MLEEFSCAWLWTSPQRLNSLLDHVSLLCVNLPRDLESHLKLATSSGRALLRHRRAEPWLARCCSAVGQCPSLRALGVCWPSPLPDVLFGKGKITYTKFFHSKHFPGLVFKSPGVFLLLLRCRSEVLSTCC